MMKGTEPGGCTMMPVTASFWGGLFCSQLNSLRCNMSDSVGQTGDTTSPCNGNNIHSEFHVMESTWCIQ